MAENLLNEIYLPEFEKRQIRESNTYKLLKENNEDTSILEGYEGNSKYTPIKIKDFDTFINEGGTKDEWIAKHVTPEVRKEFFGTIGDFMWETGKDTALSLGVAAINGADVATNLMPVMAKILDNSPLAIGMPNGFMNAETEKQVYDGAKYVSENLGDAREYLKSFKEDDNFVSQLIGIMGQDMVYSMPIYNKLRDLGVPKYPALFVGWGIGGAIGIEDKIFGVESTFALHYGAKEIEGLKSLIGILPNTPEDQIADEVVQALEYGAFSVAIPGIIDAFKFMKRYIPAFAGGTAALTLSGDEAQANPVKAIINAVTKAPIFKSAVTGVVEQKITKGTGEQIFNTIKNTSGVKESELKWIGLETFLKDKKSVTKNEVIDFVNQNSIDVNEVKFGGSTLKLSDELEFKVNEFEDKWYRKVKGEVNLDAGPNYDVYKFNTIKTAPKGTLPDRFGDKLITSKNKVDFARVDEILDPVGDGYKTITQIFKNDDYLNNGKYTFVELFDGKFGKNILAPEDLAKTLEKEKYSSSIVRDKNSLRYSKEGTYKFDELELEKYLIEKEKREFRSLDTKGTKFESYTEPGGTDYTELVFKIKQGGKDIGIPVEAIQEKPMFDAAGKVMMEKSLPSKATVPFKAAHMNVKNEIAHVRFKTRDLNGLKVLTVEEMQSDFAIAARQKLKDYKKVTDFPFKNTWYELVTKRLIRYAADNGFDAVAIPKGSLAASRYGQEINKSKILSVRPFGKGELAVDFLDEGGQAINSFKYYTDAKFPAQAYPNIDKTFNQLEKEVGSKIYKRILNEVEKFGNSMIELEKPIVIGSGKGKAELYDQAIPSFMKKYAKKWNAKVYDDNIDLTKGVSEHDFPETSLLKMPVTILELTPAMKKAVQETSQPLFELFGGVGLATWGAKAVSDNIENNIISNTTN